MSDEYQRGSDLDWMRHSNEELARLVKKKKRQVGRQRLLSLLLLLLLGWVIFKYSQVAALEELWRLPWEG